MKIRSQAGFSAVEALLLLVIVAIVGFVGYFVYSANQNTNKLVSNTPASSTKGVKTTGETTRFLVIKELGVKLKVDSALTGVNYTYSKTDTSKDANFGSQRFNDAVKTCQASEPLVKGTAYIATLTRYEGTYDPNAAPMNVFGEFAKQLPGFYLEYSNPDGGYCNGTDQVKNQAVMDQFNTLNTALKQAAKDAQSL